MIERLARLSMREQALAAGFVILFCGYVFYTAVVEPHLVLLHSSSAKIWSQEHLLMVRRQHIAEQAQRNRERDRLWEEIVELNARFLTPAETSDFLADLSVMAETAGTRLVKVDFLDEKELRGLPLVCSHEAPVGDDEQASAAGDHDAAGSARNPARKRVRLTLRGEFADIKRILEMVAARTTKAHVGELCMDVVSVEGAELNASFVITLFSMNIPDEEES
jgi:hypothetical protein